MKRKLGIIHVLLCTLLWGGQLQAATYNKNIQYYKPVFYYNGVQKYLDNSVVIIDGTTYIPARAFSNALGMELNWNAGANTLTVNGETISNLSTQMALQAKDYEIASLKKELENLKGVTSTSTSTTDTSSRVYDQTSGTDIIGTELTATEKALEKAYDDYFNDIDFDFTVRVSSSKLRVTVTYDTSSENKAFNGLSNREVKAFIEDICEAVRKRHDNIVIEGTIKYTGSNATKYYFDYSKRDQLTYSTDAHYTRGDLTESEVLRILNGYTTVTIDDYTGNVNITNKTADVNENRERIRLNVYLDLTEEMKTALNTNKGYDKDSKLKSDLKDFARRINRETDYEDIQVYAYSQASQLGYYDYDLDELYISGI